MILLQQKDNGGRVENREYKRVIDFVKSEIQKGRLKIDDKLPTERVMAEELGLSRSSIREALRTMENMGMLECRQGSGNYLTGNLSKIFTESIGMMLLLEQISYDEINTLRRTIEIDAYKLAVQNITEDILEKLKATFKSMKESQGNEMIVKDKEFHYLIIRASGNKLIISIMEALEELYTESVGHILNKVSEEMKNKLLVIHKRMLEGIVNKDVVEGCKALEEHYDIVNM